MCREVSRKSRVGVFRRVANALMGFVVCGKRADVKGENEKHNIPPVYKLPEVTVPWKGPVFRYPEDRFLTNWELNEQLEILQMRVIAQNHILMEKRKKIENELSMEDRRRRESMGESDAQFARIATVVDGLKDKQATERDAHRYAVASTSSAPY